MTPLLSLSGLTLPNMSSYPQGSQITLAWSTLPSLSRKHRVYSSQWHLLTWADPSIPDYLEQTQHPAIPEGPSYLGLANSSPTDQKPRGLWIVLKTQGHSCAPAHSAREQPVVSSPNPQPSSSPSSSRSGDGIIALERGTPIFNQQN